VISRFFSPLVDEAEVSRFCTEKTD